MDTYLVSFPFYKRFHIVSQKVRLPRIFRGRDKEITLRWDPIRITSVTYPLFSHSLLRVFPWWEYFRKQFDLKRLSIIERNKRNLSTLLTLLSQELKWLPLLCFYVLYTYLRVDKFTFLILYPGFTLVFVLRLSWWCILNFD